MRPKIAAAVLALLTSVPASASTIFSTNFESGAPSAIGGLGSVQSTQALPGATFGQQHWVNNTTLTGQASETTLSLGSLAAHSALSLTFDFIAWDSWDGSSQGFPQGDFFEILLDGTLLGTISPNNASGTLFVPSSAVLIAGPAAFGRSSGTFMDSDTAWRVSFTNIAHSAASATFSFRVSGAGWQGGNDESFGLDNILVESNAEISGAVPEPGTWLMMLLGFGLIGGAMRRRPRALQAA